MVLLLGAALLLAAPFVLVFFCLSLRVCRLSWRLSRSGALLRVSAMCACFSSCAGFHLKIVLSSRRVFFLVAAFLNCHCEEVAYLCVVMFGVL